MRLKSALVPYLGNGFSQEIRPFLRRVNLKIIQNYTEFVISIFLLHFLCVWAKLIKVQLIVCKCRGNLCQFFYFIKKSNKITDITEVNVYNPDNSVSFIFLFYKPHSFTLKDSLAS